MPKIIKLFFDEPTHTYKDEEDRDYISVTTFIDTFKEKFDTEKWAVIDAKKAGTSSEVIKALWENGKNIACERGSKEHNFLEDTINVAKDKVKDYKSSNLGFKYKIKTLAELELSPLKKNHTDIYYKLVELITKGCTIFAEKRVYSYEYRVAGTIDLLVMYGNTFLILDWKTNKHVPRFDAGYYKKKWVGSVKVETGVWQPLNKRFFSPISNLADSKGNIYALQLSMYAYLCEEFGLICKGLLLYHIDLSTEKRKITTLNIPYLKKEVKLMLETRL